MPTSATGARPRAEQGFTLVELMVCLAIVGLLAGAVVLTVPDPRPRLSDEAERLAVRLARAREEAVLTNRAVEAALDARGYRFRSQTRGGWADFEEPPFEAQAWSEGVTAAVASADGTATVRFDATGGAGPVRILLSREGREAGLSVDEAGNVRIEHAPGR